MVSLVTMLKYILSNMAVFPVGTVLCFANDTDPNNIYTHQTWERFAKGKTLVGVNENETEFNTVGKTGGEKTHKLTVAEMPSHGNHLLTSHEVGVAGNTARYLDVNKMTAYGSNARGWNLWNGNEMYPGGVSSGANAAHNNLQPYITVYYWKRTA